VKRKLLALLAALSAVIASGGTFLPWIVARAMDATASVRGVATPKGLLVLMLSIAGGATAMLADFGRAERILALARRQYLRLSLGAFAIGAFLTVSQCLGSDYKMLSVEEGEVGTKRGIGLWASLAGTLCGLLAAWRAVRQARETPAPEPTSAP
jgi:membrane associated rhomboid family serine protease